MRMIWKCVKMITVLCLVVGLMFSSALFTVLLYAKITDQEYVFSTDDYEYSVVYAESIDLVEQQLEKEQPMELEPAESAMLSAPLVLQYPELARGCEITSLTMLLQYYGIDKDKMDLLPEMKRDQTPIQYHKDGSIKYWGNPNVGFVGDITLKSVGFGIYHDALYDLLESYIPTAVDLTGGSFEDLEMQISSGIPVVVWTTVTYNKPNKWVEWDTPVGPIKTTFQEHAVLLVGYDEEYIYVNDPLKSTKDVKINKDQFIASWEAMGKQALSYQHQN